MTLKLSAESQTNKILSGSAAVKDTAGHCNYSCVTDFGSVIQLRLNVFYYIVITCILENVWCFFFFFFFYIYDAYMKAKHFQSVELNEVYSCCCLLQVLPIFRTNIMNQANAN